MHSPSSELLAKHLTTSLDKQQQAFAAYWVRIEGDRAECETALRAALADQPVVVMSLRRPAFRDANSIMVDLMELLESERELCESAIVPGSECAAVVLLSRSPLGLPQTCSPAQLPGWFPIGGGETVLVLLEDLTHADLAPISAATSHLDELAQALWELDLALTERMLMHLATDPQALDQLRGLWAYEDKELGAKDLVQTLAAGAGSVANPTNFRPSRRDGRTFTARLWSLSGTRNPEEMKASKALARALGLSDEVDPPRESLAAVMTRSSSEAPPSTRLARNVLATVYATCQLLTAGAHADEYGAYPVQLLYSVSRDLQSTMVELCGYLTASGKPEAR